MLLMLLAAYYGYLGPRIFNILLPLNIVFILINMRLHFNAVKGYKTLKFLNYQIEADLVIFVIFLLLSGGTQNPFYPFFYILVFIIGLYSVNHHSWPKALLVLGASLSLQVFPYLFVGKAFITTQTLPYLFIHFAIPLITYFVARSQALKLHEANLTLERIQRKEDKISRLKALGAMSAGLSHEFASPLHAAQLRVERMKRKWPDDEDVKECLLALSDCSHTLHSMSKVHRDLSSTRLEVINEKVVDELITVWLKEHPEVIINKNLTPIEINSPHLSFVQTLFNILDNAYEAQENNPVISVESFKRNGETIIVIKDQGPGIAQHVLMRMGEPFNTHRSGGIGLGLYSCELFMNSLGGEMSIQNVNDGTVVELVFP